MAGDEGEEIEDIAEEVITKTDLQLEKIVAQPTWKEMLMDLVMSEKLDPWNIDVVEVAEKYIDYIKKMKMMDLRIPANLILAASILLRLKSDALQFEEEVQEVVDEVFITEDEEGDMEEVPVLELKTRIPPKRKVTIDELMVAMERVFEEQKERERRISEKKAMKALEIPEVMQVEMPEYNIEQEIGNVYERVKKGADAEGLVLFNELLKDDTVEAKIYTLLPLLHLSQELKVTMMQEECFGEIIVRLLDDEKVEKEEEKGKEKKKVNKRGKKKNN